MFPQTAMVLLYLITVAAAVHIRPIISDLQCCSNTEFKACRMACQRILSRNDHIARTGILFQHCPKHQEEFWRCIYTFFTQNNHKLIKRSHLRCCPLASTNFCAVACYSMRDRNTVLKFCNVNQNMALARCINKVEVSEKCCNVNPRDLSCKNACQKIIMSEDSSGSKIAALQERCKGSPAFLHCIKSSVRYDYSYCCDQARNAKCYRKCKFAFSKRIVEEKLVRLLIEDCGYPLPQVGLYKCLFQLISDKAKSQKSLLPTAARDPNILGNLCCSRARSEACKNWCKKVLLKPSVIGPSDPLYVQCMENSFENDLSACIEDVFEPCKFGCRDKMLFCSNFNNRPLELFRRCDAKADKQAEKLYSGWNDGKFSSHVSLEFRVKNITICYPELWKALACSLVIKPCNERTNRNKICRSDCVFLLKKCLDSGTQVQLKSVTEICMMLLPQTEQNGCMSTSRYAVPVKASLKEKVQFPCQNDPCMANEICIINKDCSFQLKSGHCHPYSCIPSCTAGTSASIKVRRTELAKIPADASGKCHRVCQCLASEKIINYKYTLHNCLDIGCNQQRSCQIGNLLKDHGSKFLIHCNFCTCFDGELLCTQRQCNLPNQKVSRCNCSNDFNPVCGFNGLTYPSICHARCAGRHNSQLRPGDCRSNNPCLAEPCPSGFRCMQHSRVCLLSDFICPQYDCVKLKRNAKKLTDTDKNVNCTNQSLSHCCKIDNNKNYTHRAPVCGLDGVTYPNIFEAQRQLIPIDFHSPCRKKEDEALEDRCRSIKCPQKSNDNCIGHIPVGGCCPICEPLLRILFSKNEVAHHLKKVTYIPITVRDITMQLSHHVEAHICSTRGYLSHEGDLIIIIKPKVQTENNIEKEICRKETEKITGLINKESPLLFTNYHLSVIKAAHVQYPREVKSCGYVPTFRFFTQLVLLFNALSRL